MTGNFFSNTIESSHSSFILNIQFIMHKLEGKFKFKVSFELPVTGILITDGY